MMIKYKFFMAATLAGLALASGPVLADGSTDMGQFVKMCDTDKDGKVSKEEFMKHVEKMWAKMDTKKTNKMDAKQFEAFLKALMKSDG